MFSGIELRRRKYRILVLLSGWLRFGLLCYICI